MKASNPPFKIKITSPCPARWEDMGGDDRVRFCDQCRKNVYNLSAMTAHEAQELMTEKSGNLCARVYQRADGTVMTEDCPVGVKLYWRKTKTAVAGCGAAVLFVLTGLAALGRDRASAASGKRDPVTEFAQNTVWQVKEWLGLNPPARPITVMGAICPPPRPANPPMMGKVAAFPKKSIPAPQPPKK